MTIFVGYNKSPINKQISEKDLTNAKNCFKAARNIINTRNMHFPHTKVNDSGGMPHLHTYTKYIMSRKTVLYLASHFKDKQELTNLIAY